MRTYRPPKGAKLGALAAAMPTVVASGMLWSVSTTAHADVSTVTNGLLTPFAPISASAKLRFSVTLGSFVSLRVGSPGSTVNTATFDLAPLTAGCTAAPCKFGDGSSVAATYDGGYGAAGLPVEVKSNAGVVSISAVASSALSNGAQTVPYAQFTIKSSDSTNLPAPMIPEYGAGASAGVAIAESSAGSKLTNRSANWTFGYANTVVPAAGTYNGQVTFTASAP